MVLNLLLNHKPHLVIFKVVWVYCGNKIYFKFSWLEQNAFCPGGKMGPSFVVQTEDCLRVCLIIFACIICICGKFIREQGYQYLVQQSLLLAS